MAVFSLNLAAKSITTFAETSQNLCTDFFYVSTYAQCIYKNIIVKPIKSLTHSFHVIFSVSAYP